MKRIMLWKTVGFDLHIPADLKKEVYSGDLTREEGWFLAEIESLVQHGKSHHKNGCFASNRTLAECEGVSIERLRHLLYDLRKKGYLIIKTTKAGKRYIKTCWSDANAIAFRKAKKRAKLNGGNPTTPVVRT